MQRRLAWASAAVAVGLTTCTPAGPPPAAATPYPAACPRDASPDAAGRCACEPGTVSLLGACIAPTLADRYCGPAARFEAGRGCVFRACNASPAQAQGSRGTAAKGAAGPTTGEALDTNGACLPVGSVVRSGPACGPSAALIVAGGRTACVPPSAACPRGTSFVEGACQGPLACPPGSLFQSSPSGGARCLPIVTSAPDGTAVVDVPAWASIVLGPDGGEGSPELCGPLAGAPLAFDLGPGERRSIRLVVELTVPGQDISGVFARVRARVEGGEKEPKKDGGVGHAEVGADASMGANAAEGASAGAGAAGPEIEGRAREAVWALVESLRGLGGQASSAGVGVAVRCEVAAL